MASQPQVNDQEVAQQDQNVDTSGGAINTAAPQTGDTTGGKTFDVSSLL
jgi:hypothetical protein